MKTTKNKEQKPTKTNTSLLAATKPAKSNDAEASKLLDTAPSDLVAVDSEPEEIILTDAEGRRYCKVRDCDQAGIVDSNCRFHYISMWKKLQIRKGILIDGKLARYVEELTSRYPDKFLEVIRKDLKTEKDFLSAIEELEIDDSGMDNELEDDAQSYIDEVRGVSSDSGIADDGDDY